MDVCERSSGGSGCYCSLKGLLYCISSIFLVSFHARDCFLNLTLTGALEDDGHNVLLRCPERKWGSVFDQQNRLAMNHDRVFVRS